MVSKTNLATWKENECWWNRVWQIRDSKVVNSGKHMDNGRSITTWLKRGRYCLRRWFRTTFLRVKSGHRQFKTTYRYCTPDLGIEEWKGSIPAEITGKGGDSQGNYWELYTRQAKLFLEEWKVLQDQTGNQKYRRSNSTWIFTKISNIGKTCIQRHSGFRVRLSRESSVQWRTTHTGHSNIQQTTGTQQVSRCHQPQGSTIRPLI